MIEKCAIIILYRQGKERCLLLLTLFIAHSRCVLASVCVPVFFRFSTSRYDNIIIRKFTDVNPKSVLLQNFVHLHKSYSVNL